MDTKELKSWHIKCEKCKKIYERYDGRTPDMFDETTCLFCHNGYFSKEQLNYIREVDDPILDDTMFFSEFCKTTESKKEKEKALEFKGIVSPQLYNEPLGLELEKAKYPLFYPSEVTHCEQRKELDKIGKELDKIDKELHKLEELESAVNKQEFEEIIRRLGVVCHEIELTTKGNKLPFWSPQNVTCQRLRNVKFRGLHPNKDVDDMQKN
jgi:hypothetical protein